MIQRLITCNESHRSITARVSTLAAVVSVLGMAGLGHAQTPSDQVDVVITVGTPAILAETQHGHPRLAAVIIAPGQRPLLVIREDAASPDLLAAAVEYLIRAPAAEGRTIIGFIHAPILRPVDSRRGAMRSVIAEARARTPSRVRFVGEARVLTIPRSRLLQAHRG
jgi:hypothetical protein